MKLAVISDVHSNSVALKKVISDIDKQEVDLIIFLGDMLTYGCNIYETIELLSTLKCRYETIFIKGNHDQIYFDIQKGVNFLYKPLPDFILESIDFTIDKLKFRLIDEFSWKNNFVLNDIIFSHANPYSYPNWNYINTSEEINSTFLELKKIRSQGGVFGHTHRAKIVLHSDKDFKKNIDSCKFQKVPNNQNLFICNPGSIGQPRGKNTSYSLIFFDENDVYIKTRYLKVDMASHISSINSSSLSNNTKNKLISFFK